MSQTAPPPPGSAPDVAQALRRAGGRTHAALLDTGRSLSAALVTEWTEPDRSDRRRVRLPVPGRPTVDRITVVDALLALVLWGISAGILQNGNTDAGEVYSNEFLLLVAALPTAPVLVRSRWPLAAWRCALLGAALAATPLHRLFGTPVTGWPSGVVFALCLYTVALRTDRRIALGAGLASGLGLLVAELLSGQGSVSPARLLLGTGVIVVPLVFGHNVRERRSAGAQIVEQERRTQQERAVRAVLEERARIARELHDVVAHHMSVVAIMAEASPLQTPDLPSAVREDLAQIRQTALQAMTELRRILGVLRHESDDAEAAPQPGLDRLAELVEGATAAGMSVDLTVRGANRPVSTGVGLSVYRIVQESLSNVMRHAPGSSAVVEVAVEDHPAAVRVRVENGPPVTPPTPAPDDGPGHGLVGMRERVAMLGGAISARPTADGGFVVTAFLPLDGP